jgi:hypothetical protein
MSAMSTGESMAQSFQFDERAFRQSTRQALLMQVDAIERIENEIARQRGEKLPYPIRTCELRIEYRRLLKQLPNCGRILPSEQVDASE